MHLCEARHCCLANQIIVLPRAGGKSWEILSVLETEELLT